MFPISVKRETYDHIFIFKIFTLVREFFREKLN